MPAATPLHTPVVCVVLVVMAGYFSLSIIQTVGRAYDSLAQVKVLEKSVKDAREDQRRLRQDLATKQGEAFIEQEARDKLGLARPGDTIIVFPAADAVLGARKVTGKPTPASVPAHDGAPTFIDRWKKIFF